MEKKILDLLRIGLTEGEAKVYLALLDLGSARMGVIVKESKVAYSNIYDILRRLSEKGIVSYITKNKTKYFQAASPRNLIEYLNKKEKELTTQKKALLEITPNLEKFQELKIHQDAEIFIGIKGLRSAYIKLLSKLDKNDEHLFLYTHKEEYAKKSNLFYFGIKDILSKRKIKGISNKIYSKSDYIKNSKYVSLKTTNIPLPGNIDICKDKILLVTWKDPIIGILIQSEDISRSMREYFNNLWRIEE